MGYITKANTKAIKSVPRKKEKKKQERQSMMLVVEFEATGYLRK